MKSIKLFFCLFLLAAITTSCNSDDNGNIYTDTKDQKELSPRLDFEGEFNFIHAGNPIPFTFTPNTISIDMGDMTGSGQKDQLYTIVSIYENTITKVQKVITQNPEDKTFKAFFIANKTENGFLFNMDATYHFDQVDRAIKSKYPDPTVNIEVNHGKEIFGWLPLVKAEQSNNKIELPVEGKYLFSAQGFTYYYEFDNQKVNFNGSYSMEILAFNNKTNKILLKGIEPNVQNSYYVIQLKSIDQNSVEIARKTFANENAQQLAETEFAGQESLESNFTKYDKQ
ncbi:hypothetical protein ACYSNX_01430 [Myroides sp. LJL115]